MNSLLELTVALKSFLLKRTLLSPTQVALARKIGIVVLFLFLWALSVWLPNLVVSFRHDFGSQMSYEFYASKKFQFGVEVIQNVGPYGYLQYPLLYSGVLPYQKAAFSVLFGLILTWLVFFSRRFFFSTALAALWLVFYAETQIVLPSVLTDVFTPMDPLIYFFFLLLGHRLLMRDRYPCSSLLDGLLLSFSSLLALTKSTNLILAAGVLGLGVLGQAARKKSKQAVLDIVWFCAGLVIFWLAAGQKLATLPKYILSVRLFQAAYTEAMALDVAIEDQLVLLAIVIFVLFVMAKLRQFGYGLRGRDKWSVGFVAGLESLLLILAWKHGYVRGDHAVIFWSFVLLAFPIITHAHRQQGNLGAGLLLGLLVTVAALWLVSQLWIKTPGVERVMLGWSERLSWTHRVMSLEARLRENRVRASLPKIKEAVGGARIDLYGNLPGLMLLNDLNYAPRPVPILFIAVGEELQSRNAAYYREIPSAPEFVLTEIRPVDEKFVTQMDSLALLELLDHYEPVLEEYGLVLLKRAASFERTAVQSVLPPQEYHWGEEVRIPDHSGKLVWCTVETSLSTLGSARSFFYKPPLAHIILPDRKKIFVFLPNAGKQGFLLSPLILDNIDLVQAYRRQPSPVPERAELKSFSLALLPEQRKYFNDRIRITYSILERK